MTIDEMKKIASLIEFYQENHVEFTRDLWTIDNAQAVELNLPKPQRVLGFNVYHPMEDFNLIFADEAPLYIAYMVAHGFSMNGGAFKVFGDEYFFVNWNGDLVSASDSNISEIYADRIPALTEKIAEAVPTISKEYTDQLSDGARKILGL